MGQQTKHAPAVATRDARSLQYCGKSWKAEFACPCCGRKRSANLNFLGRRDITCDGNKWAYAPRQNRQSMAPGGW